MTDARAQRHLRFLQTILHAELDSPESLHRAIVHAAEHLVESRVRRFWRYDADAGEFVVQATMTTQGQTISRIKARGSLCGQAIERGTTCYYPDAGAQPSHHDKDFITYHNLQELWIVPMLLQRQGKSEPYGALAIYPSPDARSDALGDAEVDLLTALTNLVDRHCTALDRERVTSKLNLPPLPDEGFSEFWDTVAQSIAGVLAFNGCTLFVADRTEDRIQRVGSFGVDLRREHPKAVKHRGLVEYDTRLSITGHAFGARRTFYTQNFYREPWYAGLPQQKSRGDGTTLLSTPIWETARGNVIGLIRCSDKLRTIEPKGLDRIVRDDIIRIEAIAKELSPIVQHYRNAEHNRVLWALASHDLHAPINFIRDGAGMILKRDQRLQARGHRRLHSGRDNSDLSDIIDNAGLLQLLVDMSATGAEERVKLNVEPVRRPGRLVKRILTLLRPTARHADVQLSYTADRGTDPPILWVDRRRVEIALHNVLINAVKYSQEGTEISVVWTAHEKSYLIRVQNHGIGIPEGDEENIFRPFFRASLAHSAAVPGKGLGLYIVQRIMSAHGGDVTLERLRDPTIFTLRLPKGLVHGPPT